MLSDEEKEQLLSSVKKEIDELEKNNNLVETKIDNAEQLKQKIVES